MDVHMIWVQDSDITWLESAWDADSVSENPAGYKEAIDKAIASWGAEHVRVVITAVDFNAVQAAFQPPRVDSGPARVA